MFTHPNSGQIKTTLLTSYEKYFKINISKNICEKNYFKQLLQIECFKTDISK